MTHEKVKNVRQFFVASEGLPIARTPKGHENRHIHDAHMQSGLVLLNKLARPLLHVGFIQTIWKAMDLM